MAESILLVEDDAALRAGLKELLERQGYEVRTAATVAQARSGCAVPPGLIVLDVTLPDGDGVALCRSWREAGMDAPILFLTARDDEMDVVRGLDSGGNDYVTKPFRMQELLSRVRALLRRPGGANAPAAVTLDPTHMVVCQGEERISLTLTEYRILETLRRRQGIVTRTLLLEALWDDGAKYVDDNTLSVHMSRLRSKVGAEHIRTVRGVGYQWVD